MLQNIPNDSLIIVNDKCKKSIIKTLREQNLLKNINIMGLLELKKKYYFDYTNEATYYIHKKYKVIKSVAEMYLENLYFIEPIDDKKVSFLLELKNDLIKQKLLVEDKHFKAYIKRTTVILYNLDNVDKFYEKTFKSLETYTKVIRLSEKPCFNKIKPLYCFPNKYLEVEFIANRIASLLKANVDINKIKIANIQNDYLVTLSNIFKDFKIPLEINSNEPIISTNIVKEFKRQYNSNINEVLENIQNIIKTPRDEEIYKVIINVVNSYYWCTDYMLVKDFIFDDLSKISVPNKKYKNAIRTIDFLNDEIKDDEYVFLINFNQGSFPITKKDEEYLNDQIKNKLGISDSIDINKKTITYARKKILSLKNLIVTYSTHSLNGEQYISSVYSPDIFEDGQYERIFNNSNNYNKKELLKELDENLKYGTITQELITLKNHYKDFPYLSYNNTFKGLNSKKLMNYLNNKLTLSYSSMNTYYLCSFRYYLDNVLHMDDFNSTFATTIGNIFHRMLSLAFKENFDFETSWVKAIEEENFEYGAKEKFFLNILKQELQFIIENITLNMEYTSLKKALYEQKISIMIDENTEFKGFVDKILYDTFDDTTVLAIVDYKTGIPELKLDNTYYGLDMQLPVYAYLVENYELLKNARIGGFYLQKIINNTTSIDNKKNALKLMGYSNSDTNILNCVDSTYKDSKIIKSLKIGNNGFYAYSKVLSDAEINNLKRLVEKKIKEATINIKQAKFQINPKSIDNKNVGCRFCKYKDICYVKAKNMVKLKGIKKEEFLGGEKNATMD